MKYIVKNITVLGVFLITALGCNDKLEEYYPNPNGTTEADVSKLFTDILYNDYVRPTYWAYRTFNIPTAGLYTQLYGYGTSNKMYQANISYTEDRWKGFYSGGVLNSYRAMEQFYNQMSTEDQERNEVFMQIGKVVVYDQAVKLIDDWGNIPFTEAGDIPLTNTIGYAKFDDAEELYLAFIDDLSTINDYLSSLVLSSTIQNAMYAQDILNDGDLGAWRKYANSLRLRLLMRISKSNESFAQAEITAMLADAAQYPLVESNDENIVLEMNTEGTNLVSDLTNAFAEVGPYAGAYLLEEVMVANDDPRTEVFWDPGVEGYTGIPVGASQGDVTDLTTSPRRVANFDSLTFLYNWNIPGVLITAAEVSFIKAEAFERWGGDAQQAYYSGIRNSIEFYYGLNQNAVLSPGAPVTASSMASPSSEDIDAYLARNAIVYSGSTDQKLEKIGTQKWLNFFVLQANEAWSECRRMGYPSLVFAEDPTSGDLPPQRLLYPTTEKANNANYADVLASDTREANIFWDVD